MINPTRMLQGLKLSGKLLRLYKAPQLYRPFLSEAYQCREAWDKRFNSELLNQISPIDFFIELDQKFQADNPVHAVDMDIFASIIKDESHAPEIADLLHKFRMTKQTSFTLDSMHHAVVKYFLSIGKANEVVSMLNDRLNYGLFCDNFEYNLLMDHFIKQKDFASAAKVSTYMMLQESFEHPISNSLAIYSCFKYLEDPDTWQEVDPKSQVEEPKEEIKVRVRYLRNPYFDDHFDLWQPSDLVGKTLWWIGATLDNALGRSCQLRGLILYKKYEEAISLIQKWMQSGIKEIVYKDVLPLIKKDVPEIFREDATDKTKELQLLLMDLENADLQQGCLIDDIESMIKKAVADREQDDISKQIELYSVWEEKRIQILNEELEKINKLKRLEVVKEMKKDLEDKEQLLTFFENEESIELAIEQKLQMEKERYGDEMQNIQDSDENYISPENVKRMKR
ncbi:28S ribosomal protein S27, mitochondrial-like [Copidosoma floridanum]|uniref:28S ribosomal protein S27, mitochondrial-like n=1 Tax=Copidosoma floridanum TaxID=29053 RepID=UPI000C6FCC2A|nr:28S ribosomal protein S27, mitochondrial-like [Copidosoma floridanum]